MPTNTRKLKARIVECGFTIGTLAEKIGLSRQSLTMKMHNKVDFRATEINRICDCLQIDDVASYFFCRENSQNG